MKQQNNLVRFDFSHRLPSPTEVRAQHALSPQARDNISLARRRLENRLERGRGAPIAIVGPCSIHCEKSALEYARRLAVVRERLGDRAQIVMRVYFEKPRTTVGWKGFLYDPNLDGSSDIAQGLARARALMVQIAELGVPIATEILEPLAAEYFADCLSWVAIGARTSESQIHRQMASGLPCPVGFKNSTDGNVTTALQAIEAASHGHSHLGVDGDGRVSVCRTEGNRGAHVVLRGGQDGPNYDRDSVSKVARALVKAGRPPTVLVDCSHQNSGKVYSLQPEVARSVMSQMSATHADVAGLMIESNLRAGSQRLTNDPTQLEPGVSVTDGCIDFMSTQLLLEELAERDLRRLP